MADERWSRRDRRSLESLFQWPAGGEAASSMYWCDDQSDLTVGAGQTTVGKGRTYAFELRNDWLAAIGVRCAFRTW
jgi:hypothetical protein